MQNRKRKMKFKRKFGWLTVLVFLLAACVPGASLPASPTATESPEPETATPTVPPSPTEVPATLTPIPPTETATVTPTETAPAETIIPTRMIQMIDDQNGWGTTESEVVRTTDGGLTWKRVSPALTTNSPTVVDAFFLDAQNAWVLQPVPGNFNQGTLYRTLDAGNTWETIEVPFGGGSVQFLDENLGFMLAARGAGMMKEETDLYRTTDGGSNWQLVYDMNPEQPQNENDLPFSGDKNGLTFLNQEVGWVAGTVPQPDFVWLYKTEDGGQTWQHSELAIPSGFEGAQTVTYPPRFFDEQSGLLPVELYGDTISTVIYRTEDGGQTWTAGAPVELAGRRDMVSLSDVVVWSGGPNLQWSHDSGQTWEQVTTNVDLTLILSGFDFSTPTTGWALTSDADGNTSLYKTTDSGATWAQP